MVRRSPLWVREAGFVVMHNWVPMVSFVTQLGENREADIGLLGSGAAAMWPLTAYAQQPAHKISTLYGRKRG